MAESNPVGRPTVMTKETIDKCLLCGFNRITERCHIIPKRIVLEIRGLEKFCDYNNDNIIILCRNHHALFDLNRLNDKEWSILIKHFKPMQKYIELLLNSNLKVVKKSLARGFETAKKRNMIKRWINKFYYKFGYVKTS